MLLSTAFTARAPAMPTLEPDAPLVAVAPKVSVCTPLPGMSAVTVRPSEATVVLSAT